MDSAGSGATQIPLLPAVTDDHIQLRTASSGPKTGCVVRCMNAAFITCSGRHRQRRAAPANHLQKRRHQTEKKLKALVC